MAGIRNYGVGTGYTSSGITGRKSTFEWNERIYACHVWDDVNRNDKFTIELWRSRPGKNEFVKKWDWINSAGHSSIYQYVWILRYPSGDYVFNFLRNDSLEKAVSFTIKEKPSAPPEVEYQFYDIDGTPSGAEIWEGDVLHGVAGMSLRLPYKDHYLTFKKEGYKSKTIQVGTKPGGEVIKIRYSLEPVEIFPVIPEETIDFWTAKGYSFENAEKIAKWCIANKATPSPELIEEIITGEKLPAPGPGYKVLPTPPPTIHDEGLELYKELDIALFEKDVSKVRSLLTRAVTIEQSPTPLIVLIFGIVGVIGLIVTLIGSYPFAGFLREEALQTLDFAIRTAKERRDIENYEKAIKAKEEILKRTFWERIVGAIPIATTVAALREYFGAARIKLEADKADLERLRKELEEEELKKPGTLKVTSNIDASDVYVNGLKVGLTPFEKIYDTGTYNILVTKFKHTSDEKTVIVEADKVTEFNATIEALPEPPPEKATLDISVIPTDSVLEVAGHPEINKMGTYDVDEGTYIIKASKEGYYDKSVTVYASAGEIEEVSIILTEIAGPPPEAKGTLIITSKPADVLIEIAGHPEITSPGTYTLPTGSYTVKISKEGYYDKYATAIIKTSQETTISITLSEKPEIPPPEEVIEVPLEKLEAPFNAWKYTIKAIDAVTKAPLHADIYLDGVSIEHYTPWSIYLFPNTKYILQLERWGYKPAFVEINTPALPE